MFKIVLLLETVIDFFQDSLMNRTFFGNRNLYKCLYCHFWSMYFVIIM